MKWCTPSDYVSAELDRQSSAIPVGYSAGSRETRSAPVADVIDVIPLLTDSGNRPSPTERNVAARRLLIAAMVAVTASGSASVAGAGILAGALAALTFLIMFIVIQTIRA